MSEFFVRMCITYMCVLCRMNTICCCCTLLCVCMVASVCVCVSTFTVRSGYRLKASPHQDSMKVLYFIEKDLAQLPSARVAALKRKPS